MFGSLFLKSGIIIFPGSNCDNELQNALESVGSSVIRIWHKEVNLPKNIDIIFLPGGFSYGDYLRPGAIAAKSPILNSIISFGKAGGYIVGICNGFQVLLESDLLTGALLRNKNQKFICKDEKIIIGACDSIFTKNFISGELVNFPIAHNDGSYFCTDESLKSLIDNDQIPFSYKENPNGSKASIAGICSLNKRILGLMPHPERVVFKENGGTDGFKFFNSIIENF